MGLLKKFLGPSQSLLLRYDHLDGMRMDELEEQLDEIGEFYRFSKLSDIVGGRRRPVRGGAAVLFENARKSLFLWAAPLLMRKQIPFTVFLRPDCIGLNRLPVSEEVAAFQEQYADRLSQTEAMGLVDLAWHDPGEVETRLLHLRRQLGPLPVEKLDPTRFFATWGKILEIPPDCIEFGWHLTSGPDNPKLLGDAIEFIRRQTKRVVRMAFSEREGHSRNSLAGFGIEGLVTGNSWAVERDTDAFCLPCWPLERVTLDEKSTTDIKAQ